ncbi:hypothetical protein GOQ27_10590 [Clostridium sp. D2Q-11]|uniref:Uncharacterized protein n=1 Tax=Anaeromonas frigoriresistens TaxID=2683708 RepID=A0A942UWN1_9FIRM|nr:hypothetical protein [Anaeromonas frigoriresistens]MBS4538915.1 hypothetical protein [Anaeromonas frigoriresistens]
MDLTSPASMANSIFLINILILIGMLAGGIYLFVLIVKVSRRGIKALDIYINKNEEVKK